MEIIVLFIFFFAGLIIILSGFLFLMIMLKIFEIFGDYLWKEREANNES